jgi:hypothetical protein
MAFEKIKVANPIVEMDGQTPLPPPPNLPADLSRGRERCSLTDIANDACSEFLYFGQGCRREIYKI